MVLLTEEGFFRGVLWGAFEKKWDGQATAFGCTSLAFAAWHIYLPFVEKEFEMALWQIPIYLTNVTLLSFAWGWIRMASGSVILCCLVHAIWNAIVYTFFGAGSSSGDLELQRLWLFGPERGILGILLNATSLLVLVRLMPLKPKESSLENEELAGATPSAKMITVAGVTGLVLLVAVIGFVGIKPPTPKWYSWSDFSPKEAEQILESEKPVLVFVSPDWDVTGKFMELALESEPIRDALSTSRIVPMKLQYHGSEMPGINWLRDVAGARITGACFVILSPGKDGRKDGREIEQIDFSETLETDLLDVITRAGASNEK